MAIGNVVRTRMAVVLNLFKDFPEDELTVQDVMDLIESDSYTETTATIGHLTHNRSLIKTHAARGRSGVCKWKLTGKHKVRTSSVPQVAPTLQSVTKVVVKRLPRSEVLKAIKFMGPVTSNDLADHFNVTNNAIRAHIEDLRGDGWTLATSPAGTGTSARLYTYGGKPRDNFEPMSTHTGDLIDRCYHLTKALGGCSVDNVTHNLHVSSTKAKSLLLAVATKYSNELAAEIKLVFK